MFSMKRSAMLAMITAAAIVPAAGAQAANASKVDAPERHASIVSINAEPLAWQWSDMSG